MLKMIRTMSVSALLMFSVNASADFFGGDDCPPWAYDCNDWPEWTPMYWMEEMSNEFDDDDDYYRYGGGPWGAPYGGPMPYGPPMGAPYGGPAPYGPPMGAPYGGPMPPYGPGRAPVAPPAPPQQGQ